MATVPVTTYTQQLTATSMAEAFILAGITDMEKKLTVLPCRCDLEEEHFHVSQDDTHVWVLTG